MRKVILQISFALVCISLLTNCKHDDEVFEGPSLEDQFGDFKIKSPLTLSTVQPDFSNNGSMVFYAEFSINADWQIEITGLTTGAKKIITGNDKILGDANATWSGGATSFPAFGNEKCAVALTIPNKIQDTIRDTLEISGLKQDQGLVIVADYENGIGATTDDFSQTTVTQLVNCDGDAAKGSCYLSVSGLVGWDWAHGYIDYTDTSDNGYGLSSNPNSVFFNAAVKAVEGVETSFVQFSFNEDENDDGVFDPATEDTWVVEYWTEDSTWTLYSIAYSDLNVDADNNPVETNGNGVLEPHKLIGVRAFVLANPDAGQNTLYLDQLVFTSNRPYEP